MPFSSNMMTVQPVGRAQPHAHGGERRDPGRDEPRQTGGDAQSWVLSCARPVTIEPADPSERPLALVIVPASSVSRSGAAFTAYALHAPGPTLTINLLRELSDWLVREAGATTASPVRCTC